jgi:hypothetical protein
MSKEEKATDKKAEEVEVKETSGGKVYNFTRQGFIVEAKSLKEAQHALENHLKEQAKEEAK